MVAAVCAVLSCYLVLKGWSLIGGAKVVLTEREELHGLVSGFFQLLNEVHRTLELSDAIVIGQ